MCIHAYMYIQYNSTLSTPGFVKISNTGGTRSQKIIGLAIYNPKSPIYTFGVLRKADCDNSNANSCW